MFAETVGHHANYISRQHGNFLKCFGDYTIYLSTPQNKCGHFAGTYII